MTESVTIIGAGIAGLAAGCYARMNGYRARIYEQHTLPGGLCSSWRRKGYLADGCIEWLCGSGPGMSLYHLWEELGAMEDLTYVHHPAHIHLELPGLNFVLPTDADEMEAYLLAMAPEDHDWICELTQAVRDFGRYTDPESPEANTPEAQQYAGRMMSVIMSDFVARLQNPTLKQAIGTLWNAPMPLFFALLSLGYAHRRSAGYPIGGSLMFARAIEQRFLELGGEIHYSAPVKQILVEEQADGSCRAVGLELADGTQVWEREGDIISCADARLTLFDLLGGRFVDETIQRWFDHVPVIGSPLMVTLGVDLPLKVEPSAIGGILMAPTSPVTLYGQEVKLLNVHVFDFDPTAAPEGKSAVRVNLWGNYPFWKDLHERDKAAYEAEKERIVQEVIAALDVRFPGLAEHVEMIDVATPLTFERYTSNWQGSGQGWMPTGEAMQWSQEAAIQGTWPASRMLPGLEHFYMSGQWVEPFGGLPTAGLTSRGLIEKLCARDGKEFIATKPSGK